MAQSDRPTAPTDRGPLLQNAEQPLVLSGPPRGMRGEFRVQNSTASKIIVRQPLLKRVAAASTRTTGKAAAAKAAAAALPAEAVVLRRIVVRPGQSRPVPIALTLDPTTPPGTYEAQLDVEGEQRTVLMHVTEDVTFSITPDELVLPNRPGEKVQKQVVFTNDGNVPLSVRTIGPVVLDEELAHCRALRGALDEVGDTMKNLDDFLVALGKRYKTIYATLALKVQNEKVIVAPGETKAIDLTITLPEKLEPRSRYTGYAAISSGTLTFTIVPD
jgi:hypothetical protein